MENNGDEAAIKYLEARRNMHKVMNERMGSKDKGHYKVKISKTYKDKDGKVIHKETQSEGYSKGGLVSPNQDTSKKIKGKPTVWNNLYTEMTNNIKNKQSTKTQPMTSMVKPMVDPKVKPKQLATSPTSAINNKVSTLTNSSEEKVQRSKQSTTTTRLMVMRQHIIRSVQAPAPKVIDVTKSPSPLIT